MVKSSTNLNDELLLDVTRMVWRTWRGRHPTGIDRVCLAYVGHFRDRARAVFQWKGRFAVLSVGRSKRLFDLLLLGRGTSKADLVRIIGPAIFFGSARPPRQKMAYLNVGHTGLNDRAIAGWIEDNRVRAFYLIHDLIPITNPEFCRPNESEKHKVRMGNALQTAAGVIGNSQVTLDELSKFAASQAIPMPAQVVAWICGFDSDRPVERKLLERPYFVAVGTIEARKNHLMLLQVWTNLVSQLGEKAPILVVIGQPGWEADEALGILSNLQDLDGSVRHFEDCNDDDLAEWISGAQALLMPSIAEGFGLPIIEALALGTPVIARDLPVYREIVGDIPTYLEADNAFAWEAAIRSFQDQSRERERQLRRVADYRPPTWSKHFEIVERWLATV